MPVLITITPCLRAAANVRRRLTDRLYHQCRSMPVVDNDGKLVGYISRTDLIKARPKRVVLVDHNERSQAVDGIEEAELLGIIDITVLPIFILPGLLCSVPIL